ncbi:hypothetical protein [Bradyrhizobium sp. SZCCHNRI2007]|uniref:hypothetical protein n=1 Tax=Bradyrhizobium sp. SZCCHNRI2007 TaxID=3057281 RepID=UPI0028EE9566|nr:hypothetical protein [Bradyrhizobium sp. SZCCHNRI2007]
MSILSEFIHSYAPQNGWGTFFTAAFGAFAGAFAASRAHNKRTIVAELHALNAAHQLSIAIANIILALKRQNIAPLEPGIERLRLEYESHKTMVRAGSPLAPFRFELDMHSLFLPATPHVALEKIIFEKTLVRGRALAALVSLVGTIDSLGMSIEIRNEMVEERRTAQWNDQERLEFFLGLRSAAGIIDQRFPTNIEAITRYTDDCIFFAKTLATDLAEYANTLRWKASWFYYLRIPKIDEPNWSWAEGLIPNEESYSNWLRGFPSRRAPRWKQFFASLKRKAEAT